MDYLKFNLLTLKALNGIGDRTILYLLQNKRDDLNQNLNYDQLKELIPKRLNKLTKDDFNKACKIAEKYHEYDLVTYLDSIYPDALKQIYSPPPVLFFKGNLDYAYLKSLAIVGMRKATSYGIKTVKYFVQGFSYMKDFTIISGLAYGIDSIAHEESLVHELKCVAVLGSGLNNIYPLSNKKLAQKIIDQGGAVISELFPDTEPQPHYFPLRNRIIAGLSRGVLVIEAGEKSGSLITAKLAFDEGRFVFSVPADIFRESYKGNNLLIKNNISNLVLSADDILTAYGFDRQNLSFQNKSEIQFEDPRYKVILDLLKSDYLSADIISSKTGIDISEVNVILQELEILDIVRINERGEYQIS
ncbi:MAG: DNA-processing protein DprA [Candidatus Dojkabacteria bacterium]|nr:DNA-processing protein DprA [Candidatus Dojkabacteria bacterium]